MDGHNSESESEEGGSLLQGEWDGHASLHPDDLSSLLALIECSICLDYLKDAVSIPCCGALFDRKCIDEWCRTSHKCPMCRAPFQQSACVPNVAIQRFVDSMRRPCPYHGCTAAIARSDLQKHIGTCAFRPEALTKAREEKLRVLREKLKSLEEEAKRPSEAQRLRVAKEFFELCHQLQEGGVKLNELLPIAQLALECSHRDPLCLALSAALRARSESDPLRAITLFQEALGFFAQDDTSAEVADLLREIALVQVKAADYESAEKSLKRGLEICRGLRSEGFNLRVSSLTAHTLTALATVLKKNSRYKEAADYLQKALDLEPNDLKTQIALADVYRKLGPEHFDQARPLYVTALRTAFDPETIAECANALGLMEKKLGQYKSASKYFKAAIKNLVRQHGTLSHSAVGICQTNMADVYRKLGEYERAESLYHSALNTLESTLGPTHIEVGDLCHSLGLCAKKAAKYDEAMQFYKRALEIAKLTFKNSPSYKTATYLTSIGDVERKRRLFDKALEHYKESIAQFEATVGADHLDAADPLIGMALVFRETERFDDSLRSFNQGLRIVEKTVGRSHYKFGAWSAEKGLLLAQMKTYDQARTCLEDALKVLTKALGTNHVEVADVLIALGDVSMKIFAEGGTGGSLEQAKKNYTQAQRIVRAKFGDSHPKAEALASLIFIADQYGSLSQ